MSKPSTICVVPRCKNNNLNKDISFHIFPKDPSLAEKWLKNIDRPNWEPKARSLVCSAHFTNECFEYNPDVVKTLGKKKKSRLITSAIPTIFPSDSFIEKPKELSAGCSGSAEPLQRPLPVKKICATSPMPHRSRAFGLEKLYSKSKGEESISRPDEPQSDKLLQRNTVGKDKYIQVYNLGKSVGIQAFPSNRHKACQTTQLNSVNSIGTQTDFINHNTTMTKDEEMSDIHESDDESIESDPLDTSFTPSSLGFGDTSFIRSSDHLDVIDNPVSEPKFLVFQSALLVLFKYCFSCLAPCTQTLSILGSLVTVKAVCKNNHTFVWESQPKMMRKPLGNLLTAAAILFAGLNPTKVLRMFKSIGIAMIQKRAYCNIQEAYLIPAIREAWIRQEDELLTSFEGKTIDIGGDGRCDSPGYSALFGSYCFLESTTKKVIHLQLVQSTEVNSSQAMELEGLRRGLRYLEVSGITVGSIVTDRHKGIRKHMREEHPAVKHFFDCWHLAKGVKTKIEAAGKKKNCEVLLQWKRSIVNHVYWCAVSSYGNAELAKDKWLSVLRHVTNVHTGHGGLFPECAHEQITPKEWLVHLSEPYNRLAYIVKLASHDIGQLSPTVQTSNVEAYHSVVLHFASKSVYYPYKIMEARLFLSVLHFNENSNKAHARKADGTLRYSVSFPKAKLGEYSVRPIKEPSTYDYVQNLFKIVMDRAELSMKNAKDLYDREVESVPIPRPLSAQYVHPEKSEAIESYKAKKRFRVEENEGE